LSTEPALVRVATAMAGSARLRLAASQRGVGVEGFPVALFDFAVVVPAEQAPVGLIGPAADTAGRPLMPSGVPSLQDHGGHAQQHESCSGKDAE
jgi:hypothetical protein